MKKQSLFKQKLIPVATNVILTVVSLYCFLIYYSFVSEPFYFDLNYGVFLICFLNGLLGLTKFVNDDTFSDLRILLDYASVVLTQTFMSSMLWEKCSLPYKSVYLPSILGMTAFLFFVLMEYKRQDLTDLALIVSIPSSMIVSLTNEIYLITGASAIFGLVYFMVKRGEECMVQPTDMRSAIFNVAMAAYCGLVLVQYEPSSYTPAIMS